jgi:TonB family protein
MRSSHPVTLASTLMLAAQCAAALAQNTPPAGEELRTAHLSWKSDPAKSCPELRQSGAEPGAVAVVQFMVGPTGVPSRVSIHTSSGSAAFDAAAMSCVLKLHFQPSMRFGDGVAVESWQQMPLKLEASTAAPMVAVAAPIAAAPIAAAPSAAAPVAATAAAATAATVAATARCEAAATPAVKENAGEGGAAKTAQPGPQLSRVGVCVCVDDAGKLAQAPVLTSSSGIAGVDQAALELSSAARYRPATSASGQPAAGCFHFKVGIEVR